MKLFGVFWAILLHISSLSTLYMQSETVIECFEGTNIKSYCPVEWNPHNNWLAVQSGAKITIWDTSSFEKIFELDRQNKVPNVFKWSPNGDWLVIGDGTYDLLIWEVETSEIILSANLIDYISINEKILGPYDKIQSISWNNLGTKIAISHNGTVSVWDLETNTFSTIQFVDEDSKLHARTVNWSSDGEKLLVLNTYGEGIVYDGTSFKQNSTFSSFDSYFINSEKTSQAADWSPDGDLFAVALQSLDSSKVAIVIIRNATGTAENILQSNSVLINSIDWHPELNLLAVASGDWLYKTTTDNSVKIWNTDTDELLEMIEYDQYVMSVSWHPCGNLLAVSTYDSKVHIVNIET